MNEEQNGRILVGMSGGLDSTYTALRYKAQGYDVEGAVLRMSAETDVHAAALAAEQVGIPLHVLDAQDAFETYVKSYFANEYAHGRTPNPCVMCNRYVKIAVLCDYAETHGIPRISTGHYAHIGFDSETGRYYTQAAADRKKDQSYFLWQLTQKQLSMLETPLADCNKAQIREEALEKGLRAAQAKESQDICFLPNGDYIFFVEQRLGVFPTGDFIDERGMCVGQHQGIIRYTVGQRKGLGIALGHPVFVSRIDAERNTVHLAPAGMEYRDTVTVRGIVCQKLRPEMLCAGLRVAVKIRYAAKPALAVVTHADTEEGVAQIQFDTAQRAVTPGQSAVFYDSGTMQDILFGGWIV
ncbi:MAG: tRNA 2-thiouridine(34) synthase MnmA [Clostridia bacterium]|nr:tRNA 2-thiouridine(34) synthase MnmA [Clostridia bacterium]